MNTDSYRISLVTRGDDAGSCQSANRAIVEDCTRGLLRNVSIMVPGPAFESAAEMLAGGIPGVDLGLHMTLNSEWDAVRWGPILPRNKVPSLVDDSGMFFPWPNDLVERKASIEEMIAEIQAQLDKARRHRLDLRYIDEHMGIGWLPGLREKVVELAQREGLLAVHTIESLPKATQPTGDRVADIIARLAAAPDGTHLLLSHPTYDDEDARRMRADPKLGAELAIDRNNDRQQWLDPRLAAAIGPQRVRVVRYSDVLSGRN